MGYRCVAVPPQSSRALCACYTALVRWGRSSLGLVKVWLHFCFQPWLSWSSDISYVSTTCRYTVGRKYTVGGWRQASRLQEDQFETTTECDRCDKALCHPYF